MAPFTEAVSGAGGGSGKTDSDPFQNLFTPTTRGTQPSAIREICRLVERPEVRSLAGGWPDPQVFPANTVSDIARDVLASRPEAVLQYGSTEGLTPLRKVICEWITDHDGIMATPEEILILHGSQQGMDLACRVFIEPGDVVISGSPSYFGGFGAVRAQGGRVVGVPVDSKGMNTEALAETLAELKSEGARIKGIYVIPNYQNPAGSTLTLERRHRLLALAQTYDLMVFEDDPYGELCFDGGRLPSLYTLDDSGRVIHIRSMSKTFAPGLRIAWLAGHKNVVRKMAVAKQFVDCCTNSLAQHITLEFILRGHLEQQIAHNVAFYRKKRDRMHQLILEYFPREVRYTVPTGGFFFFMRLPKTVSVGPLLQKATAANVVFIAGAPFYPDGGGEHTFRLSYSQADNKTMEEAIEILGKLIRDELKAQGA